MANFFFIGGDGKEYGPVSAEELRKWVQEGRADAQSQVRAEGASEWVPLPSVPELADAARRGPPPMPIAAPRPSAGGKMSALAVTSLVLGILGLFTCGTTALFGLIFGIIALVKTSRSGGGLRGWGLALAGTILSGIFLLMMPIFAAMLLPALAAAHAKAAQINCMNNEKQLALAVRMYSDAHSNHLPPAATWCDAIKPTVGADQFFRCPADNGTPVCSYAFNAKLDGMAAGAVNPQTVMIFEADAGWNGHGGPEIAVARHQARGKSAIVAFADGSVQVEPESQLSSLRWDP
jgi:prepilin-type processing-associated H-X9-DG protein